MTSPVEGATTDEVAAVDKPMCYWDDRAEKFVYRASALMSCQNALLLARMGVQGHLPPEWLQERFDEGHEQEDLILRKLDKDFGFQCYAHQQEVELPVGKTAMVRGHIDALSTLNGCRVSSWDGEDQTGNVVNQPSEMIAVVDAKALAPSGYDKWRKEYFEGFLYYLWQQATYLYAGEWDAIVMAVKNKVSGKISVDVFTKEWIQQRLPKSTLMQRVLWVESQAKRDAIFELPCSPEMWPCPFFDFHPPKEKSEDDPTPFEADKAELRRLGDMVLSLEATAKATAAEIATAKENIANHIGNRPIPAERLGSCTVSAYHSGGSQTMWKEITEALGEKSVDAVKVKFTRKTKSDKLTIKVVAPDAK